MFSEVRNTTERSGQVVTLRGADQNLTTGDEMLTRCAALATGMTKQTVTTEERGLHREA